MLQDLLLGPSIAASPLRPSPVRHFFGGGDAIMALIGDKATALIESHANDLIENAMNDFNIHDHEYEIGDMIDERLPEGLDDESRSEDLKAAIKEVLSGATLTMDIE